MSDLQFRRNIHDGVHGLIRLTDEEMLVIDHPLFQRLRWICQTGLMNFISPSAQHKRFEHSLGVVHIAQHMFEALFTESHKDSSKLYGIDDARPGQAIRFHEMYSDVKSDFLRILRLSALVHDLGHGPLSHAFESFAPKVISMALLLKDKRLASLISLKNELLKSKSDRMEHESISCILFAVIWHDMKGESWVPAAVASVLLGIDAPSWMKKTLRPWIPLIRDLISSAPIDADRMDYMLRDSKATNVCYGLYEPNRVLKSILCVRGMQDGDITYRLGWRKSGLPAIESFATARYQMYVQMYHHKTMRAIELMLYAIRGEAVKHNLQLIRTDALNNFLEDYLRLSDETFLRILHGELRSDFPNNVYVEKIADQLLRRKLWKRVYESDDHAANTDAMHIFAGRMKAQYPDYTFIVDTQPLKAMKDLERGAYLLTLDAQSKYSRIQEDVSWLEASSLIRALKEKEISLVRLFMEDDGTKENPRNMRKHALRLARE